MCEEKEDTYFYLPLRKKTEILLSQYKHSPISSVNYIEDEEY